MAETVAMQPGDRALLLGLQNIPGFFGNVIPGGGSASTEDPNGDYTQTLTAGAAGRIVVIAAMGGKLRLIAEFPNRHPVAIALADITGAAPLKSGRRLPMIRP